MSLPVVWSPRSKDEYADLLNYVESNFGLEATLDLLDKTDNVLANISEFPNIAKASIIRVDIRKAFITKQTSVLYQVFEAEIQLLHFWDNRRNPKDIENLFKK